MPPDASRGKKEDDSRINIPLKPLPGFRSGGMSPKKMVSERRPFKKEIALVFFIETGSIFGLNK